MRIVPDKNDVAVAERVSSVPATGEEMVAAATGDFAGRHRSGDCVHAHIDAGAVFVSLSVIDAPPSRHFCFLP